MSTIRRCDKRCHEAKKDRCRCWCGGAFHGAKGAQARENLSETISQLTAEGKYNEAQNVYKQILRLPEVVGGER